ncbi:alginate lyase family protein [Vulgatibacter sp.]|uniref:heparinase II/III family protein n=1 Tax=Vulgatibacter sp. TaxID=1971226 RepID=UPI0035624B84
MDRLAYIGYLARTVPPHRLAQVAALRLWRGAWRTLEGGPQLPAEEEVLRAFGARSLAQLPRRVAAPVPGPWGFASPPAVASTARTLRTELPQEAERAVARAEAALERRSVVFGREVVLPGCDRFVPLASAGWRAIDWEVDPVSGARFDGGSTPPGADIKYPWVPGRLDEVVHLACGAVLTAGQPSRSRAFADAALDRILDLAFAPRGVQWSCAMEVALRAANVAIAVRLLAGHAALEARPEALLAVLRSLVFHLRWVEGHLEDTVAVPNNHLVSDLVGPAVVGALLPRLPGAAAGARRALRQLERELLAQTLPDGLSFEGSVPYHRLAVELFLLADLAAQGLAAPFGREARERLAQMFVATRELGDGRGLAPQIGDNDSGQALAFRPRGPQEQAWLLPIGAALFERKELHLEGPSAELVWLLGAAGLRRLERMPLGRRPRDSALRHGGVYVLRSERLSCAIACGSNGTGGTGTHGHNDKLAVEICVDGRQVIGDPGTGSYTGDPALRNRLRGTAAHSTVIVEGEEQQPLPSGRLFALPDSAHARCLRFTSERSRATFLGEHRGYERLTPAVIHQREVVLDRLLERILIRDELQGSGKSRAEARYLVTCGAARVRPIGERERAFVERTLPRELPWDLENVVELGSHLGPLALLIGAGAAGAPRFEEATYARGYGELAHALHVCFRLEGVLPSVFTAAVLPFAAAAGR